MRVWQTAKGKVLALPHEHRCLRMQTVKIASNVGRARSTRTASHRGVEGYRKTTHSGVALFTRIKPCGGDITYACTSQQYPEGASATSAIMTPFTFSSFCLCTVCTRDVELCRCRQKGIVKRPAHRSEYTVDRAIRAQGSSSAIAQAVRWGAGVSNDVTNSPLDRRTSGMCLEIVAILSPIHVSKIQKPTHHYWKRDHRDRCHSYQFQYSVKLQLYAQSCQGHQIFSCSPAKLTERPTAAPYYNERHVFCIQAKAFLAM